VYAFVRRLIEEALSLGDEATATKVQEALKRAGTTASEQLGEIDVALRSVRDRVERGYAQQTIEGLDEVVREIDGAFRRAGNRPRRSG
jgi:hypothetical protein